MARRRSNTVGNKIKQQENLAQKQSYQLAIQEPLIRKVMVKKNKCTLSIQVQNNILGDKLFQILENQAYVTEDKQIVFFKGQKIIPSRQTWMRNFYFSDKDVLHLHNKDLINKEFINVTLTFLNTQLIKYIQRPLTARPDENIRQALEEILILQLEDVDQSMYVQSGRFINISSTFKQQSIQDGSIILVMPIKQSSSILMMLQQRQIEIIASRTKLFKRASLIALQNIIQAPNFKKKYRSNVYKSIFIPESKQLVWEQDTNSQFSRKTLIKTIIKKKTNKSPSINLANSKQNFSRITNIGSSQRDIKALQKSILPIRVKTRQQLLNEGKRLNLSACLLKVRQAKQKPLKQPPKMKIQTIQAQQITSSEDSQQQSNQSDQMNQKDNPLKFSAPIDSLKKSVGGFRNQFPPRSTYTPPILMNNDDQDQQFQDF